YVGSADAGVDRRLATRGPGGSFGDIALLSNRPRSTTVRADTAGEVLRLERTRFLALVAQEPVVALAIAATVSEGGWLANGRGVGTVEPREAGQEPRIGPRAAHLGVAAEPRTRFPGRRRLGGALAILILALTWVTPPPAGLHPAGWRALGTL